MNPSRPLFAVGLIFLAGPARAQLAANSPFLPPPGSAAAAPVENRSIELRGIMPVGPAVKFCIYDTARKTSTWAGLNETGYDFTLKAHDPEHDTVTVEQGGRTFTLSLRDAKVASAGQAVAPMPVASPILVASAINRPNPMAQTAGLNSPPADALAADVARRRAIREQSSAQPGQVAPPAPVVQPVQAVPPAQRPQRQMPPQGNAPRNQTPVRPRTP